MYPPNETMLSLYDEVLAELNLKEKDVLVLEEELEQYLDKDSYETINVVYYGEPKAQARLRANSNLNTFYDPSKSFKLTINEAIRTQLGNNFKPINREIYFVARFYKPYPKSTPKKKRLLMELGVIRPTTKPDLDNYEKLLYDALLHTLYNDDSVIVSGYHQKFYSVKPRVEIEITFRKTHGCND